MAYRHHRFPLAAYRMPLPAVFVVLLALALLRSIPALAAGVVGSGTPESCTEAALDTALAGGGMVTFNCGGATTITVTSTKIISADTTIDGGSLITISGGNSVGIFVVNIGVNFTVQNLTIANGIGGNFGGGGIANSGTLTVTNSTFSGNRADAGGAISNSGDLTVTNCTFSGNSSSYLLGAGGAISNSGNLIVTNSTFSGNSAEAGGAISNGGDMTVTNCTFSGNNSPSLLGPGGGAINNAGDLAPATLFNTILANNFTNNVGGNCEGSMTDGGHNIDDGTSCAFSTANGSLSNTNPQLDPAGLANNGGPTQTIALQAGSPAINAGDESVCTAAPVNSLDQRGYVRPGTGYANCSIGAFEYYGPSPPACDVGDCNRDGAVAVDEIITLVNIALGTALPAVCAHGVPSGPEVNVALIIQAVNNALSGCSG